MKKINFGGLYKNMLGIIGAMDQEVSILKEKMEVKKKKDIIDDYLQRLLWNFMWEH